MTQKSIPFGAKRKRKKQIPVHAVCRNCGTSLVSRYCHNCGQYLFSGFNRSVKDIIYNAFDSVFAWDNKLFRTLQYLLFFPGKLTKEYISGKVVRYVHPAKLFWFITLIFFMIFTFWMGPDVSKQNLFEINNDDAKKEGLVNFEKIVANSSENSTEISENLIHEANNQSVEENAGVEKLRDLKKKNLQLSDILDYLPYAMFVVIPFFALLLQVFFYKKQHFYAGYLIFAFHFHAFIFLLFTILSIFDHYFPDYDSIIGYLLLYIPPIYFIIALWVVFRSNIFKILWKVLLIMFIYGIMILIVLFSFSMLIVKYIYQIDLNTVF